MVPVARNLFYVRTHPILRGCPATPTHRTLRRVQKDKQFLMLRGVVCRIASRTAAQKVTPMTSNGDRTNQRIGDFTILRDLGEGAMAKVYLAEQNSLRRNVALKVLHPRLAEDETYVRRFHVEAQAAASLVHAHIVQIYDVGCQDGTHYIAQEYVPGINLRDYLASHPRPPLPTVLRILIQVCAALCKAAEQRIVHRDIKPENILLSESGDAKVADFGLARVADRASDLTQLGVTMGTPLYMSPEQIEGKPLDPRSDLYSLGVMAYQMLTGQLPFSGDTSLGVAVAHLHSEPPSLLDSRPDVDSDLVGLVVRLLAKKPEDRFESPRDVLRRLSDIAQRFDLEGEEADFSWRALPEVTAVTPLEATRQLQQVMRQTPRGRKRVLPLLTVALLLFITGAAVAWMGREPPVLPSGAESNIPIKSDRWKQLLHAKRNDTERAWREAIDFQPNGRLTGTEEQQEDRLARDLAKLGLARYFLNRAEWQKALALLDSLARQSDDPDFRACGQAGKAIALHYLERHEEAAEVRAQIPEDLVDRNFRFEQNWLVDWYEKTRVEASSRDT